MNVWIQNMSLIQTFNDPTKNLIVQGNLTSPLDISIKVNNLIVLGEIITPGNVDIFVESDFFYFGEIKCKTLKIRSNGNVYRGINNESIKKVRALGIKL